MVLKRKNYDINTTKTMAGSKESIYLCASANSHGCVLLVSPETGTRYTECMTKELLKTKFGRDFLPLNVSEIIIKYT